MLIKRLLVLIGTLLMILFPPILAHANTLGAYPTNAKLVDFPIVTKAPTPPDFRDNYQQTVVIPAQKRAEAVKQAQEARDAAKAASVAPTPPQMPQNVSVAEQAALAYARPLVGADQWSCLYNLWEKESGWNPYSINRSSGAYGIPQALGHGNVFALGDYAAQIHWGLAYISARYLTPCAAWSHSQTYNWY